MIKNIVFDFGNVLIKYSPEYMVSRYVDNEEDKALLVSVLFDRLYWDKLDDGSITDEEVVKFSCERLPQRLHSVCREIYYNWVHNLPPVEGMWELVNSIKEKYSVRLFLLSNIGTYFVNFKDEFSVLSLMEECIFSASVGYVKPNFDMFEYLCTKCNIIREETLFIDDSEKNIKGASDFGILGYLFDGDAKKLSCYINNLGLQKKNK